MSLEEIKFQFATELSSSTLNAKSRRYSKELKKAVVSAMKSHGLSVYEISKTLGLSATAVYKWISKEHSTPSCSPLGSSEELFIPAKMVTAQGQYDRAQALAGLRSVTIHMPSGEKIELNY